MKEVIENHILISDRLSIIINELNQQNEIQFCANLDSVSYICRIATNRRPVRGILETNQAKSLREIIFAKNEKIPSEVILFPKELSREILKSSINANEAKSVFLFELGVFHHFFASNLGAVSFHPILGHLNYSEWKVLISKQFDMCHQKFSLATHP